MVNGLQHRINLRVVYSLLGVFNNNVWHRDTLLVCAIRIQATENTSYIRKNRVPIPVLHNNHEEQLKCDNPPISLNSDGFSR